MNDGLAGVAGQGVAPVSKSPSPSDRIHSPMRVALVTEELSFGKGSGGIGGAFHELALALAGAGCAVDIIYLPIDPAAAKSADLVNYYADCDVRVIDPGIERFVWNQSAYEARSYGLFRYLTGIDIPYSAIHFHDYKGLGFFSVAAKRQKLAFATSALLVQLHGPSRWALQANGHPFTHADQLKIDFMERESIARADVVVSPSRFMLDWIAHNSWQLPPPDRVHILQNVCTQLWRLMKPASHKAIITGFDEIVFFGRHEERKGLVQFCDALDKAEPDLWQRGVKVSFLGGLGLINGDHSALYLAARSRHWRFEISVLADLDRMSAARYLGANPTSLVVIPSPEENSPYTVLEAVALGKAIITSDRGGARELLAPESAKLSTCPINATSLAAKLQDVLTHGLAPARAAQPPNETEAKWLQLHEWIAASHRRDVDLRPVKARTAGKRADPKQTPKVTVGIVHFERPAKLYDAVLSMASQTYSNLEIIVIDDGSSDPATLKSLERLRPIMDRLDIRIVRQENLYLGAARNRAARDSDAEYLLFLDDDDIAFPHLVQTLVTAAEASAADIVNCLNLYMPESRRGESYPFPDEFAQKVSYIPLGGPLAMTPIENCIGAATALIRRDAFVSLGGYTEDYGVGHEDFELYVRAIQAGYRIEICPLPLYLYEVDRPSMASSTSRLRNASRVLRAVDLSEGAQSWRDLISVVSGRQAREHIENFAVYNHSMSQHAALLRRIMNVATSSAEYARLVSEYAQVIGSRTFAQGMHRVALEREKVHNESGVEVPLFSPLISRPGLAQEPDTLMDDHLLLSLAHLSFGRLHESVSGFKVSLERCGGRLCPDHMRYLRSAARHPKLMPEDARRIVVAIQSVRMTQEEFISTAAAIFQLGLVAANSDLTFRVLDRVSDLEERSYLAANPDVAKAVAQGAFVSGLTHYLRAGVKEGRPGYAVLSGLSEVFRLSRGVRVPPNKLRDCLVNDQTGERMQEPELLPPTQDRRVDDSADRAELMAGQG